MAHLSKVLISKMLMPLILISSVYFAVANAAESPKPKLTLEQRADKARIDSQRLEQAQLEKARQAAKETAEREDKIKQQSQTNDWETQQKLKAQKQFDERESREQKYLREAKEAAAKERKIPKP
ncbi:hypothetical protein G3444_10410 [Shewanella baltica]|uniref:hypothetical protein n=1 Tax=Shewanella baltica TaxID=62322 RepID=UPI00217D42BE|nr:hypothetical protein [Shewanella baltica]MCS6119315.1 hypothetical protein [Shewanella baltica]MCS6239816.1 hypothetical protein [Shewanella baltica]